VMGMFRRQKVPVGVFYFAKPPIDENAGKLIHVFCRYNLIVGVVAKKCIQAPPLVTQFACAAK